MRIVKVMRVTRLFKLSKKLSGLRNIIKTLLFSIPSLMNVGAIGLLFFYIYAILGSFIFKDTVK
jgi:voltage-gated sodium channel